MRDNCQRTLNSPALGLAEITDPDPPGSTALRAADRAYQAAIDDIIRHAGLAA